MNVSQSVFGKRLLLTAAFLSVIVVLTAASAASSDASDSGTCGNNLTWILEDDGDLFISGSGSMDSCPWDKTLVKTVTIGPNVTSVYTKAFYGCSDLDYADLGGAKTIGSKAFANCPALEFVYSKSVVTFASYAFYNSPAIGAIDIPSTVTSIGYRAFHGLTFSDGSQTLDQTVEDLAGYSYNRSGDILYRALPVEVGTTIDEGGLTYTVTSLSPDEVSVSGYEGAPTSVQIPQAVFYMGHSFAVTAIDAKVFYACASLEELDLGDVKTIGMKAFAKCSALRDVRAASLVTIGGYAFYQCYDIDFISLPSTLKTIGKYAFYGLTFSTGSKDLAQTASALRGYDYWKSDGKLLRMGHIEVGNTFTSGGVTYEVTSTGFGTASVVGCSRSTTDVIIPDVVMYKNNPLTVDVVAEKAFYGKSIRSVDLGNVTTIGLKAFAKCTSLAYVELGESLVKISGYAFYNCKSLEFISIPATVQTIGNNAFHGLIFTDGVSDLPQTASALAGHDFGKDEGKLYILVPQELGDEFVEDGTVYRVVAFGDEYKLDVIGCEGDELYVPPVVKHGGYTYTVRKIVDKAFYNNDELRSVIIMSVESVGMKAFANCVNLEGIAVYTADLIGSYAFYNCKGTSIVIGDHVTAIGKYAFAKCSSIVDLYVGYRLATIGERAFQGYTFYDVDGTKIDPTAFNLSGFSFKGEGFVLRMTNLQPR